MLAPTDPLFAQQWHLPMLGNIQKVWREFTGAGVTVAVYDDGVQFSHADLAANYDASKHFKYGGVSYVPTPLSGGDAHGTACAGLIGAVDNNGVGGVGVAHGVKITGIDYLNTLQYEYDWDLQQTSALYDATMRWAAGFDIMSNSWGTFPDYSDQLNPTIVGNSAAVDAAHFAWVSANGRGGLGTIVVKAAGNDTMNANGSGDNVSRHSVTVAATDENGFAADYSNFGSSILVTAPAGSVTTDLMGIQGYNRNPGDFDGDALPQTDYTSTFGGTSAATPIVSGVVALMLDAKAGLGWRDVQGILAMSAGHTGSAVGAAPTSTEVGSWQAMGGTQWNGGGAMYHLSYGFGMVDAYAAVRMAEVWTRLYGVARTSANEVQITKDMTGPLFSIPDAVINGKDATPEAEIAFVITQDIEIDSVQVTLDIFHSYAADVSAFLRSPTGELMQLFADEGGATALDFGLVWTFAAEAFRGMSSLGTWVLELHDDRVGGSGVVYDAQLQFYGTTNTVNDVYHFTDDFKMLRDLDAGRRVIDDSNGGTDWLNFAAMTGKLSISMAAGGAVQVNGVLLATLGAGVADFEKLQAGDGNDVITGNALGNTIYGGRGRDRINGAVGDDRVFGDAGNDTLSGAAGNDSIHGGIGEDSLLGGSGNDVLRGEGGNDVLAGDTGNDWLGGGAGADLFVFTAGLGRDTITDWADNLDTLRLDDAIWGGDVMTVAQVLSTFGSVVAGSAVLNFGTAGVITLQGFANLASLSDDISII